MYTQAVMDAAFLHGSTFAVARRSSNYLTLFDTDKLQACICCDIGLPTPQPACACPVVVALAEAAWVWAACRRRARST